MKKQISLILCALMSILFLTGCGKEVSVTESMKEDAAKLCDVIIAHKNIEDNTFTEYTAEDREFQTGISEEEFAPYAAFWIQDEQFNISRDAFVSGINSFMSAEAEIGKAREAKCVSAKYDPEGNIQVIAVLQGAERETEMIFTYSEEGQIIAVKFTPIYSMGENMGRAALNTLMGMGVVFSVLILISLIISLFGYIPKIQGAIKKKKESKDGSMDNTIQQIISKEEELSDDCELVAVIAAAIASYEGTSTDGFVVRSIRKAKKWQRS